MTEIKEEDYYGILISGSTNVTVRGPGTIERILNFGILIENSSRVTITRVTCGSHAGPSEPGGATSPPE